MSAEHGNSVAAPAILPLVLSDLAFDAGGKRLLSIPSLEIGAHALTVVLGPNGSGKSLLLRLAHGLLEPSRGSVRWCGAEAANARRHQAMVFERPVLLRRSVAANVSYALALRGIPRKERLVRVDEVLERTGLSELRDRPARVLSAGEQQRLALARAWVTRPEVLFLDEPSAALDPSATRAVEALIARIALAGTKVVMTTHDMGQARRLADEVVFLYRGQLVERAPTQSFFDHPSSPAAKAFLEGDLLW